MPRYKDKYTRDGVIDLTVVKRQGDICLLKANYKHTPELMFYEVHRLQMKNAHPKAKDAGMMVCCSPSMEEWGKHGWTFTNQYDAETKYQELTL